MKTIKKHNFEAVSLLTVQDQHLEITVVPVIGHLDWLVPTNLILSVDAYAERIWTYLWQGQEVAVFQLSPKEIMPDKIVVLEGNTEVHRIGLQIKGQLQQLRVKISDVKDVDLPDEYRTMHDDIENNKDVTHPSNRQDRANPHKLSEDTSLLNLNELQKNILSYAFICVEIDNNIYLVPDLDLLAHHLVDLDS